MSCTNKSTRLTAKSLSVVLQNKTTFQWWWLKFLQLCKYKCEHSCHQYNL